jgi:hypothetical protein
VCERERGLNERIKFITIKNYSTLAAPSNVFLLYSELSRIKNTDEWRVCISEYHCVSS